MYETITEAAISYITGLFEGNSGGHDTAHTMRVYHNALKIAAGESGCNLKLVELGALLHDADDHKLFKTENNANARTFLKSQGVAEDEADEICRIINAVSFSQNKDRRPETIEGMIVQDADRLDAIGAIGIARTFAFGGEHGRSLDNSIEHFHEKLLLLKDLMNTETAKELAERRHDFMVEFLKEYADEM